MMNIVFVTCSIGILGMCAGMSLSEEKPWSGDKVLQVKEVAVVLVDNEYLLNPADYGKLEQGGGLLVQYPAVKGGDREGAAAFYFENRAGKVVDAVVKPVSGNAGQGQRAEQECLALVSPVFPLNQEGKWSLRRKGKVAELFRKKVVVSHLDQEYTFQSHEDAETKLVHGVLANALVTGNSRPMLYNSFKANHPAPPSPGPLEEDSASSDREEDEREENEEEQGNRGEWDLESGLYPVENIAAVSGSGSLAAPPRAAQDIVVTGGGRVSLEEGYDGTVRMEGSGDIFLDSVNVSDDGNKEKHYKLNISMEGGSSSKVYLGFTNSTARTAFLEGTVSGTGTLVFENTSRSRVSIFDLTGADMSGFSGVIQTAAPRSSLTSEGYNTPVQIQAAGDMSATVVDLSVLRQGGKDPANLGGWLTGNAGTPSLVILKLEGDLSISGLEGTTAGSSSRVTAGNGTTVTLTIDAAGNHEFKGVIGALGADGGYYVGTEKNESYKNNQIVEADGTGVIHLVKTGSGEQAIYSGRLGRLDIRGGVFRLGADGALTVGELFSTSPGGLLDIAAGAALTLDYHETASRLDRMNWKSAGTLVFNKGLDLDVDGTFQMDSSVRFAEGSLLTVIIPESGIQSGDTRKLISVTEGNSLSFADAVQREKVRYATGRDADGNWIYRDVDVYSGLTLDVQGNGQWQMLVTGLDSTSLEGTYFDADKFSYYVWQGNGSQAPDGSVWCDGAAGASPWEGGLTFRNGEREVLFGMQDLSGHTVNSFDVTIDGTVRVSKLTVSVDREANGGMGYIFHAADGGTGNIADAGPDHAGMLVKEGGGMLTLATGNTFSGGTDIREGSILAAREGALGSGDIRMADGTELYVNYPFATELDSYYRNPFISNNIRIGMSSKDTAKVVIGYSPLSLAEKEELPGGGSSGYQWDYLTSRHWRTLSLTGRLDGYGELTLMGYTSTTAAGQDKWVSMFRICDEGLPAGEKSNFTGTVKLDNYILYSTADSSANADANNDLLAIRKPGAVQLIVEDDALRNAKVDLTRSHTVNAADNGTAFEGKERMDLYHILLVQDDAVLAGLQGDLIGKTQDSEYYGNAYTVESEVDTLRVLTNSNSTLTLNVNNTDQLYFAGVFGTASTYGSATSGKVTAAGRETLSLTKTGAGAQYIHTATVNRLVLQEGTLGFNNLNVKTSAVLYGGSTLELGVTRGIAADGTLQEWGMAGGNMTINSGYALHIVTDKTVNAETGTGSNPIPETAVVNGSVTVSDSSFLYFDCSLLPSELQEHPLLAIRALEGIAESGRLNLNGDILVRFGGYDFGETNTVDKKYYLAATDSGIYVDGVLGGFQTRTISVGNGWFGIIKISEDNRNLIMTVTNTPIRTWYNGENRSDGEYVAATDNVWFANELAEGEGTGRDHWLEGLDKNLGLNGFYRDTYHVAFGEEGAGKTGAEEREGGEDYNVVLIKGEVRPASIRVKDDVNYIFRSHADGGLIADGELPEDYETSAWKTILTKDGAGTLVMETANTYSGGTEINGGRVVMRDGAALGTGEIRMFDGTFLTLDYQSTGFAQKVARLNNLLTVAENSVVTVSHTDKVIGGVISSVRGDSTANLVIRHANSSGQTVFQLDDGSKFHGKISMGGTENGQGMIQVCLDRNTWEEALFDLSLNGVQNTVLHLYSVEDAHHLTLAGIMGQDEASFVTTEASTGRDSSTTLFLALETQERVYHGNVGFGQYIDMHDTGKRHDSGYVSLVKTGIFSQTVGNARLAALEIEDGTLKVENTLFLTGNMNVGQDGNLVVGSDEWQALYDYDVQVNDGGVLRLGSGFGSLSGTPYTEDGVQKTGNTILLNGGGVLGMLDADWSNDHEMVVNAGGKALILDTTGYDPDSMTASGDSHVMTLNGVIKPGDTSGTIIVKNDNAGKNGRVVLGAANAWDGTYLVTDHAALELAHAGALNTKSGVELQGTASRLDVKAETVSYAGSVKLTGAGASVNTLNSSSLSDISVAVTAREGASSSTVERASLGSSAGTGIVRGASSSDRARFSGVNVNVRTGAELAHTEFSGSVLEVGAGQEARVTDMLIHAADSGIRLGEFSSLAVSSVSTSDSVPNLNISYADGNFSMTAPDTWTTNALITGAGQASVDFSGGVNLLLTECSGSLMGKLVEARVSAINFVLYDGSLANTFNGDSSLASVLYDAALKNAGFILANEDSWMRDGVVTLVRTVPEPGTASVALLGLGALLLRRRRN